MEKFKKREDRQIMTLEVLTIGVGNEPFGREVDLRTPSQESESYKDHCKRQQRKNTSVKAATRNKDNTSAKAATGKECAK